MKPISEITVQELRQIARTLHSQGKLSLNGFTPEIHIGRWIADASKTELVSRLIESGVPTMTKPDSNLPVPANAGNANGAESDANAGNGAVTPESGAGDSNGNGNGSKPDSKPVVDFNAIAPELGAFGESLGKLIQAATDNAVEAAMKNHKCNGNGASKTVTVKIAQKPDINIEKAHKIFDLANAIVNGAGQHLFLTGPTGSGKSHLGSQLADVQAAINGWSEPRFYPYSTGRETSRFDLLGYMDANGNYVKGILREPFENGGLLLLDEIDSGSPAVLTVLNSALANGHCSFPDAVIKRHKDFRCVATANTWGNGYDSEYVGRNKIDAATLNRFVMLEMNYDLELERALAQDDSICQYIQDIRVAINDLRIQHILSPRQIIQAGYLLQAGLKAKQVQDLVVWRNLDKETRAKISTRARELSKAANNAPADSPVEVVTDEMVGA